MHDPSGYALSGATAESLRAFQSAQDQLRCYIGDPAAGAKAALQACSEMTMAHLLTAYLNLLGTEPAGVPVARSACEAASQLDLTDREQRHLRAASLLAHGQWHEAGRALEDLSIHYPRDLLALQVGHQVDFFTGDSRMLRDRIARALPMWQRDMPGYHAMLSMYAFGLEETGDYTAAERYGRAAVEMEPRDGWGWHAVAHVLEMRNQPAAGSLWLRPSVPVWSRESFFAVHNFWHLALFLLEIGDTGEVLALYDESIGGAGSSVVLDMVDASAMLWRLQLRGVDVGDRWSALADRWAAVSVPGHYAFNDLHAMMAYVSAGRNDEQQALIEGLRKAVDQDDDNARFTQDVGYGAARAIQAFADGDFGRAVELLRIIRNRAYRFGGSHAQRDILDLTLIEAARRSSNEKLTQALAWERACLRPRSPLAGQVPLPA